MTNENIQPDGRGLTGKIARLPRAIRRELQRRLLDGWQGAPLLTWLNGLPEVQAVLAAEFEGRPITKQNLSQWRTGPGAALMQELVNREDVTSLLAEISGLRGDAKDRPSDQVAFYLAMQAAMELKKFEARPETPINAKIRRDLRACLLAFRRADIDLERCQVQRLKYGLRPGSNPT